MVEFKCISKPFTLPTHLPTISVPPTFLFCDFWLRLQLTARKHKSDKFSMPCQYRKWERDKAEEGVGAAMKHCIYTITVRFVYNAVNSKCAGYLKWVLVNKTEMMTGYIRKNKKKNISTCNGLQTVHNHKLLNKDASTEQPQRKHRWHLVIFHIALKGLWDVSVFSLGTHHSDIYGYT